MRADGLSCDDRFVPRDQVLGFEEHYDPWSGKAWLHVRGAAHDEPIHDDYGVLRAQLRTQFPDRPFDADWSDGHFPAMPMGVREPLLRWFGGALAAGLAALLAWWAPPVAWPVGIVLGWVVFGSWGRIRVSRTGVHLGPGWSPELGWHEVSDVHVEPRGSWSRVSVTAPGRFREGTVPTVLVPALRAKVWRLGGLTLEGPQDPYDRYYRRWAPVFVGLSGAVAVVGSLWALTRADPWAAWGGSLLAAVGFSLVAAAADARSGGWGTGAVLALTALYGLGLVVLQLSL